MRISVILSAAALGTLTLAGCTAKAPGVFQAEQVAPPPSAAAATRTTRATKPTKPRPASTPAVRKPLSVPR